MKSFFAGLIWLPVLISCQHRVVVTPEVVNPATRFVQAYNQQDIAAMLQWVHEDVRYMFIEDDQLYTETQGKQALAEYLPDYFKNSPDTHSSILYSHKQGYHITQVFWGLSLCSFK